MGDTTTQTTEQAVNEAAEGQNGFTPITSQEEFDKVLSRRLTRAEKSAREKVISELAPELEKAKQYDALQEANKSELEKANERAASAEAEVAKYKHRDQISTWANEVSQETGIPANVLRGDTKEELQAHAEALKAVIPQKSAAPVVNGEGGKPVTGSGSGSGDWLREMIQNS